MLEALSEGCGVGVSSLVGGWLRDQSKDTTCCYRVESSGAEHVESDQSRTDGVNCVCLCYYGIIEKSCLTSRAHVQLYKYINIIQNITMETDTQAAATDGDERLLLSFYIKSRDVNVLYDRFYT